MYCTILCLITILANIEGGPLPKLRYRPPKWSKLQPIRIMQTSKEAFAIPHYRKFETLVQFEEPDESLRSLNGGSKSGKPLPSNEWSLDNNELSLINDLRSLLEQDDFNDNERKGNDLRSLFVNNDFIHLTKQRKKQQNNLLNIVEQLVDDEGVPSDQEGRGVMEVSLGLKRGLRRQGGLPPKLVYEFNELVDR